MFERHFEPLISREAYLRRIARSGGLAASAIAAALFLGVSGYHWIEGFPWVDSILNAAMILGGMGPVAELHTTAGKLFAAAYALFSGLMFIGFSPSPSSPTLHRKGGRRRAGFPPFAPRPPVVQDTVVFPEKGGPVLARILTVANQKGGVGKTTTAVNLAASLSVMEKKTLLVDLDPQANASSGVGGTPGGDEERNVYRVLMGEIPAAEAIRETGLPFLYVLPASADLIGAEIELVPMERRERRLAETLAPIVEEYEVIVIDCPPSLGLLTVNALCAADSVLIPLQCEYYALEGLSSLFRTIDRIREEMNPGLRIEGVALTMFDARNNLAHQVADEAREILKDQVFQTVIPRNVRLSESPSHGKPALLYAVSSRGAQSYLELAREMVNRWNGRTSP